MKNAYPEKPFVPFHKTAVEMGAVVAYLKQLDRNNQTKIMAYIVFRNESWNGAKGVNNNYAGIQADSGRWPEKYDKLITGVVIKNENGTGKERYFCAFDSFEACIEMLIDRLESRGMYIGGKTNRITSMKIENADDLCLAYFREWVEGNKFYTPDSKRVKNFMSMYRQAVGLFTEYVNL